MALNESTLRRIIREEARRVMNEAFQPGKDGLIKAAYTVGVKSRDPDEQREEALRNAVKRADEEHPGYDWALDPAHHSGMRISRSPYEGDRYGTYDFIVWLVGRPMMSSHDRFEDEGEGDD